MINGRGKDISYSAFIGKVDACLLGFAYRLLGDKTELFCDSVPLRMIAEECGTPTFVYSQMILDARLDSYNLGIDKFRQKLRNTDRDKAGIFYAVKACPNLSILNILRSRGTGFDTVSMGEMRRALRVGAKGEDIVLSGVGKSEEEIEFAIANDIKTICVESRSEFDKICNIARKLRKKANISVRVNPAIEAKTHPSTATGGEEHKFGVDVREAEKIIMQAMKDPGINLRGISCHIGSQILDKQIFLIAAKTIRSFYDSLLKKGVELELVSLGGGFGIGYRHKAEEDIFPDRCEEILDTFADTEAKIILEPGRSLVAHAGCLLTKVQYIKETKKKNFIVVDAAMNDLIRPTLYDAYHEIYPIKEQLKPGRKLYDVVGPVCETGDFLAKDRSIQVTEGDYIMIADTGAYGYTMSSHYNSRPRAAEVLVESDTYRYISRREGLSDLLRLEEDLL